jgi:hypothetical protein
MLKEHLEGYLLLNVTTENSTSLKRLTSRRFLLK